MKTPLPQPPNTPLHDHANTLLALQALQGLTTPEGPGPSAEELAQLADGDSQLDVNRRNAIYQHLNADPALLRQWLALTEASQTPQASASTPYPDASVWARLSQWFSQHTQSLHTTGRWLTAGATAAALLIAVLLFKPTANGPDATGGVHPQPQYASLDVSLRLNAARQGAWAALATLTPAQKSMLAKTVPAVLTASADLDEQPQDLTLSAERVWGQQLVAAVLTCQEGQWAQGDKATRYLRAEADANLTAHLGAGAIANAQAGNACARAPALLTALLATASQE
ncbi:hypothetical protein [Simiduia aestuariiviva]|uniref:Uncharacterized protein n=1 Tax=Simiduia aestuariiviva TaxID=1510459 RepID=A0A839UJJ7_9GAMM|nr:hypothetical protein [Simiduia aestuariiviva]MBB3168032.1 hypothetical protein [Simiduia aestuariiviva]